jgi:hypothetical protein
MVQPVSSEARRSLMRGVLPMASMLSFRMWLMSRSTISVGFDPIGGSLQPQVLQFADEIRLRAARFVKKAASLLPTPSTRILHTAVERLSKP